VWFYNLSSNIVKFWWLAPVVFSLHVGGVFYVKDVCFSVFDLFLLSY
jgi:hypothetical protein